MYSVYVRTLISSAHRMPGDPGKCGNLHGHDYEVIAWVRGRTLGRDGTLVNALELEKLLAGCLEELDHDDLNKTFANPTMEVIAEHVFACLSAHYLFDDAELARVEVNELRGKYGVIYEPGGQEG